MRWLGLLLSALASAAEPGTVRIPAGTFTMGRTKLTPDDKTKMRPQVLLDDRPEHKVSLEAFRMHTHEVTQAEYGAFVKATKRPPPYHWKGGDVPSPLRNVAAYNVTWDDAKAYCQWRGMRLPTEAEWERAARGGIEGADYPWGETFDAKLARHNTETGPGAPGRHPANRFGLFDMAGNMAEWTADWFAGDAYKNSPAADPPGPATGAYKVIRGGAWSDPPKRLSVFFRNWVRPSQRQPNIGFRCAMDAPPVAEAIGNAVASFDGMISLYAKNLSTSKDFELRADERVRTASTIKLPILVAMYQAVADGKARWDDLLTLEQEDKVSGSGILREFSAGTTYALKDLANLMIVVSDNTATNLILDRFTADYVNQAMAKYGFVHTRCNRKVLGGKGAPGWSAFGEKEDNRRFGLGVSTPREMARLIEMLDRGQLVDAASSAAMLDILRRQQITDGIARHLGGYTVASKSGALDALRSDVALITRGNEKFALAITVDGMPVTDYSADNVGNRLISELTALLLEAVR